jgi:hypothetical protein
MRIRLPATWIKPLTAQMRPLQHNKDLIILLYNQGLLHQEKYELYWNKNHYCFEEKGYRTSEPSIYSARIHPHLK